MTLRKHPGSGGRTPGYIPYASNSTSPTEPVAEVSTNADSSKSQIPQSSANNVQDRNPFAQNMESAKSGAPDINEQPPLLRTGSSQLSTDALSGPRGPPLPLEVPQALATPETSLGGWEPERSSSPAMQNNVGTNEQFPGSMKSNTSNPFRHSMERISLAQADLSTEASSAGIWAGEANGNHVHPQAWTSNAGACSRSLKFITQVC